MIIVTGAGKGLGREISERLVHGGHQVLGLSRTGTASEFRMMNADVSDHAQLKHIALSLKSEGHSVDGLINAAGIAAMNLALMTRPEKVTQILHTNLQGTIFSSQVFAPLMIRSGGGSIINFSTIAVSLGLAGEAVYAASKAGVESFSRVLARELSSHNIRVNCIAPGPIATDLLAGVSDTQIDRIVARQVIQERFKPADIADLVEILLDPKAKSLSGQVLNVGGV